MSCQINASTSAGLVMSSDLSGVLTFAQNGVALPNGGVAPAFSAYQSSAQTITAATYTKVQFQTKEFDTNNNFDNATNYRFTPTVAGYYQINSSIQFGASGNTISLAQIAICKNGVQYKVGGLYYSTSSNQSQVDLQVSSIVYLNGATDYVELYGYNIATTPTFLQGSSASWFNGCLVRGA